MKRFVILLLLVSSPAVAQQTSSPAEQALGIKLMQEIQAGLNCNASTLTMQAELNKAQARIKELEAQSEKKK